MGLFRGHFPPWWGGRKQPISLTGAFPLLHGPEWAVSPSALLSTGLFSPLENRLENSALRKGPLRGSWGFRRALKTKTHCDWNPSRLSSEHPKIALRLDPCKRKSLRSEKITGGNSTQNKISFWTISVGFLTRVTGEQTKVQVNFSKKFVQMRCFLGVFWIWGVGFGGLASKKLKKAVAVSEEKTQEHSWRRGRFSSGHLARWKVPKPWQG